MDIQNSDYCPDATYFRASTVAPELVDGKLIIRNGEGTWRSWGAPQVRTSVVVNEDAFTAVHFGFSHKHGGGQQWMYYVDCHRKFWAELPDDLRSKVLANLRKA